MTDYIRMGNIKTRLLISTSENFNILGKSSVSVLSDMNTLKAGNGALVQAGGACYIKTGDYSVVYADSYSHIVVGDHSQVSTGAHSQAIGGKNCVLQGTRTTKFCGKLGTMFIINFYNKPPIVSIVGLGNIQPDVPYVLKRTGKLGKTKIDDMDKDYWSSVYNQGSPEELWCECKETA